MSDAYSSDDPPWTGAGALLDKLLVNLGHDPFVRCAVGPCRRVPRVGSDRCADCHVQRNEWVRVDDEWVRL